MKAALRDMGVWVIVPVKPLNQAKTRLSQVLSPEERQQLAETMLRHVLSVVQHVPQLMGTLVNGVAVTSKVRHLLRRQPRCRPRP